MASSQLPPRKAGQISADPDQVVALIEYLRDALGQPALEYAEPPYRITGGFDTLILALRLDAREGGLAKPLILRLFRPDDDPQQARFETIVQNAVASLAYPAPRVLHVCADPIILGGPFMLMERLPGKIMLELFFRPSLLALKLPGLLADFHLRLHALDAGRLRYAIDGGGFPGEMGTVEQEFSILSERVGAASLSGLIPLLNWLLAHRPKRSQEVICHGDFHPLNVLMHAGSVSGVIDWRAAKVAEPAYDVGSTLALFTLGPIDLPRVLLPAADAVRRLLIGWYYSTYTRRRPLAESSVRYYEALRCLWFLVEAGEYRQAAAGVIETPSKPSAFTLPRVVDRIVRRTQALSGVAPELPR